jgi:hypothetical protein
MTAIPMIWTGETMEPLGETWRRRADKRFVVGQKYLIDPDEERSEASHRQFFAAVREAWMNLPDRFADAFPTETHLRKHALIRCGFRDETSILCASKAEALRVAAFVKSSDEYAIVTVQGALVTRWTAKSQSQKAMGKAQFQESKDKVLDWIAKLIGTDTQTLASTEAA